MIVEVWLRVFLNNKLKCSCLSLLCYLLQLYCCVCALYAERPKLVVSTRRFYRFWINYAGWTPCYCLCCDGFVCFTSDQPNWEFPSYKRYISIPYNLRKLNQIKWSSNMFFSYIYFAWSICVRIQIRLLIFSHKLLIASFILSNIYMFFFIFYCCQFDNKCKSFRMRCISATRIHNICWNQSKSSPKTWKQMKNDEKHKNTTNLSHINVIYFFINVRVSPRRCHFFLFS